VLRAEFEATRQDEIERSQAHADVTTAAPRARITRIEVLDERAVRPVESIRPRDTVVVRATLHPEGQLSDWMLGLAIDTPLGVTVYGTNTQLLEVVPPSLTRDTTFDFRLPELALGEGRYTVRLALAGLDGHEIHRLNDAAHIEVRGDGRSQGPLAVSASFAPSSAH
jgi:ABC-2 type transport system ATP-binding protein